jgi:IS30 family transposase
MRHYLRKHSGLSIHTADTLKALSVKLNDRPRKRLNWRSPAQLFPTELKSHSQASVATAA